MPPLLNRSISLRDYLWPRRLVGQIGLVTALALTAAQVMNVFLLLNEQQPALPSHFVARPSPPFLAHRQSKLRRM
jgi:hypothetical protein